MSDFLQFKNITMVFPGVKALDDMSFSVKRGEIVAFLGENGAGKSTLLKILNGDYHQTEGEIYIDNKIAHFQTPNEAIKAGISVIYQERQLVPYLSVAENIFLGAAPIKNGFINFKDLNDKAQKIIDEFEIPINATDRVRDISVAYQQMVEIMKSYARNAEILCFDEPTAPLTDIEITVLFRIINKLKAEGKAIIYVTHRIKEIFELTDRIVVFKDGKLMGIRNTKEVEVSELIHLMVGRDLGDIFDNLSRNDKFGDVVLKLNNVTNENVNNISFDVREGEILGLAGLAGAGRTETAKIIFGVDHIESGTMEFMGNPYRPKTSKDAMKMGIALCPEDRKIDGLILHGTVNTNTSLAILDNLTKNCFINDSKEREFVENSIKEFNVKTPSKTQIINNLSGGNQQKVILARWMGMKPKVMIFDEPTKGIDVGAKSEIYNMICETAKKGVAVILISSELPEIMGLADRILILKSGSIAKEYKRGEYSEEKIIQHAMFDESDIKESDIKK